MVKRILIGKLPDGPNGFGLRISKPGYDVEALRPGTPGSTDNEKLVFNSDWQTVLPIYITGQTSVSSGGTATVNFPENLGYIPFASAFVNVSSRGWEKYTCANACYRLIQKAGTGSYCAKPGQNSGEGCQDSKNSVDVIFSANPQNVYIYEGDRANNLRFNVFNNRLTFYSSGEGASLYYIIYRMKAF
jgi:hypothetical protein